jgi:hypothetical protein
MFHAECIYLNTQEAATNNEYLKDAKQIDPLHDVTPAHDGNNDNVIWDWVSRQGNTPIVLGNTLHLQNSGQLIR